MRIDPSFAPWTIWLHLARLRAGQDDRAEFAGNAERLDANKWPAPVVAFYLGRIDAGALRAAAAAGDEKTRDLQACHADFYLGAIDPTGADARRMFQSAADHCPNNSIEHRSAVAELKRLDRLDSAATAP